MLVDVGATEQSQEVHGVFQVVGEVWDEKLMKSVGSTSLASETDAYVTATAATDNS